MAKLKRFIPLLVSAALGLAALSAVAQLLQPPRERPDALMKAVTSEVVSVLKQDQAAGRQTQLAELIELKVLPLFDFPRMTAIAMGRNWRLASPEQQLALVAQFKALLVRTYSAALSAYKEQEIVYRPLRSAAGDTEVLLMSYVRRAGAEPLTIDYDMQDSSAGWQVFDVKIAGVSLVLNYRESFADTVRSSGIDGLIRALAEKNRPSVAQRMER